MKLTYVRVLVDKFDECLKFYRDGLGLKTVWSDDGNYAEFEAGGSTRLALFKRDVAEQALSLAGTPGGAHRFMVVLEADDVDKAVTEIATRGIKAIAAPVDRPEWTVRTAHFLDPDGNLVEINKPLQR
ncbi:MAG TPA: VOC family protein [Bryobacteraceae bacterium]|nr:VOC family protein [Bryobacteraceae bacterium]